MLLSQTITNVIWRVFALLNAGSGGGSNFGETPKEGVFLPFHFKTTEREPVKVENPKSLVLRPHTLGREKFELRAFAHRSRRILVHSTK